MAGGLAADYHDLSTNRLPDHHDQSHNDPDRKLSAGQLTRFSIRHYYRTLQVMYYREALYQLSYRGI